MSNNNKMSPEFLTLINQILDQGNEEFTIDINNKEVKHPDTSFVSLMNKVCDGDTIAILKTIDIIEKQIREEDEERNKSIPPQLLKDFLAEAKKLKETFKDSQPPIIVPINDLSLGKTIEIVRENSIFEKNIKNIKKNI